MEIEKYYNKIALSYQKKISTGVLGRIRRKERKVVFEFLDPQPNEYILEAGCGTGSDSLEMMNKGSKVQGFDISHSMVDVAVERGVDATVGDIEYFNFNREFDKICSMGVLEFCKNHDQIFGNFNKHLRENGITVIHFPYKSITGLLYLLYHLILNSIRIKLFTYNTIKQLAEKSGFRVLDFKKAHNFIAVIKLQKISNVNRFKA